MMDAFPTPSTTDSAASTPTRASTTTTNTATAAVASAAANTTSSRAAPTSATNEAVVLTDGDDSDDGEDDDDEVQIDESQSRTASEILAAQKSRSSGRKGSPPTATQRGTTGCSYNGCCCPCSARRWQFICYAWSRFDRVSAPPIFPPFLFFGAVLAVAFGFLLLSTLSFSICMTDRLSPSPLFHPFASPPLSFALREPRALQRRLQRYIFKFSGPVSHTCTGEFYVSSCR